MFTVVTGLNFIINAVPLGFMARSNRDRYGNRHRKDSAHDIGDSAPGTVGDSEGTFHDRVRKNNNVIVDGEVKSLKNQDKKATDSSESKNSHNTSTDSQHTGKKATVKIDRISANGNAIAEYNGMHVHVDGALPGETHTVKLIDKGAYYQGKIIVNDNLE